MWSPAEEDSPCWRLNRAEHISARHDQLAFLSRSDLSPQMPSKFSRYRFRVTSVQHLWKAYSKGEKVEEKCLSKESSTGSHFITSLSLSLSLSLSYFVHSQPTLRWVDSIYIKSSWAPTRGTKRGGGSAESYPLAMKKDVHIFQVRWGFFLQS